MNEAEKAAADAAAAAKVAADAEAARKAAEREDDDDEEDHEEDDDDDLPVVDRKVKGLVEGRGGTYKFNAPHENVIKRLLREAYKLRQKNTKLRARAVDPGDVLLKKGSEAESYEKLKALGLKPEEIVAKVGERDTYASKLKQYEQDTFFNEVAEGLGYSGKGKRTFVRVAKKEGVDIQMREVEVEDEDSGKKRKEMRPYAKLTTEADDKLRPLDTFVVKELGDYLPAFEAEGSDESEADDGSDTSHSHAGGKKFTPMVDQSRASAKDESTKGTRSVAKRVLDRRYTLPEKKQAT